MSETEKRFLKAEPLPLPSQFDGMGNAQPKRKKLLYMNL